jgi:hypothetical protein
MAKGIHSFDIDLASGDAYVAFGDFDREYILRMDRSNLKPRDRLTLPQNAALRSMFVRQLSPGLLTAYWQGVSQGATSSSSSSSSQFSSLSSSGESAFDFGQFDRRQEGGLYQEESSESIIVPPLEEREAHEPSLPMLAWDADSGGVQSMRLGGVPGIPQETDRPLSGVLRLPKFQWTSVDVARTPLLVLGRAGGDLETYRVTVSGSQIAISPAPVHRLFGTQYQMEPSAVSGLAAAASAQSLLVSAGDTLAEIDGQTLVVLTHGDFSTGVRATSLTEGRPPVGWAVLPHEGQVVRLVQEEDSSSSSSSTVLSLSSSASSASSSSASSSTRSSSSSTALETSSSTGQASTSSTEQRTSSSTASSASSSTASSASSSSFSPSSSSSSGFFDFTFPPMTAASAPAPFVTSASAARPDRAAYRAFDHSGPKEWRTPIGTTTGWIQIFLGAGNAKVLRQYGIMADNTGDAPKDWTVYGSNNGSSWVSLGAVGGFSNWVTSNDIETGMRFFTVGNSTAYTHYRLDITANHGGHSLHIAEVFLSE